MSGRRADKKRRVLSRPLLVRPQREQPIKRIFSHLKPYLTRSYAINTETNVSFAAPAAWHPPKSINYELAFLQLLAPPAMQGEVDVHNEQVGEAWQRHRAALAEASSLDPATVTPAEVASSRGQQNAAILVALQELSTMVRRAVELSRLCSISWRDYREALLEKQKTAEANALKLLKKLHGDEDPRRLQGRLADVADVMTARRAVGEALSNATTCDRTARSKQQVATAVDEELRLFVQHLVN